MTNVTVTPPAVIQVKVGPSPNPVVNSIDYGSRTLKSLTDVDKTTLADGYSLEYNAANNNFIFAAVSSGNVDRLINSANAQALLDTSNNFIVPGDIILSNDTRLYVTNYATELTANVHNDLTGIYMENPGRASGLLALYSNDQILFVTDFGNGYGGNTWTLQRDGSTVFPGGLNFNANGTITFPDTTLQSTAFTGTAIDQSARAIANSAGANTVYLFGISDNQNNSISYISGVDAYQNIAIGLANTLAQTAYALASTSSANDVYIFGVQTTQNNNINLVGVTANSALPNIGTVITVNNLSTLVVANNSQSTSNTSGALTIAGGLGVIGNIYSGSHFITGAGNNITFIDGTTGNTTSISSNNTGNYSLSLPGVTSTLAALTGPQTFTGSQSFSGQTNLNQGVSFGAVSSNIQALSQTIGAITWGGPNQTGTITLGQSTLTQTTNIHSGATTSNNTKTINFGLGGLTGSNTLINIGPSTTGNGIVRFGDVTPVNIANTLFVNQMGTFNSGLTAFGTIALNSAGGGGSPITIGGQLATGNIILGQSAATQNISIGSGGVTSGNIQSIYIGTNAQTGATNQIFIGTSGLGTGTINMYGTLNLNSFGQNLNLGSTSGSLLLATSQTTGPITLGGGAAGQFGLGLITLGQSQLTQTLNIQSGNTQTSNTKTINIGLGGQPGSNTIINIGSSVSNGAVNFGNTTLVSITNTTSSISNTTGALVVSGGIGVQGNVYTLGIYTNNLYYANGVPWVMGSGSVRVVNNTSSSSITIDSSITDQYSLTALAVGTTFNAPTGSPTAGQKLIIRIKDNGTAQTLAWNAIFRVIGVTLPTTTVANKTFYIACIYNLTDTSWDVVSVTQQV